jgi:hypothetical protein
MLGSWWRQPASSSISTMSSQLYNRVNVSPVIPLKNLMPEHLGVLLAKIRRVFTAKTGGPSVRDEALVR